MAMNAREVIRILRQEGFEELRQNGSHRVFGKGSLRTVVPDHGGVDIRPGTLNSIWEQAGLPELKNVKSIGQAMARLEARGNLPTVGPNTPEGRLATSIMENNETRGFWSDRNGRVMHFFSEEHKAIVSVSPSGTTLRQFDNLEEARHYFGEQRSIAGRVLGDIPDLRAGGLNGVTDAFRSMHSGRVPRAVRELGEDAARVLGRATKILGVVGAAYTGYEATNLAIKSHEMAEFGMISSDSLVGYDAMLAGFIAQATVDPTLIGGEAAIQAAFDAWASEYDISPEIKAELQPGLLINDIKDLVVAANETLKNATNAMIENGAPLVEAVMEEVGERAFENMSREEQLGLIMDKIGDTLDDPSSLQRLLQDNAREIGPNFLQELNRVFDINIPNMPSIVPSVPHIPTPSVPVPGSGDGGNWYDILPSMPEIPLPSLPNLRDFIPRIDLGIPGLKFGALEQGEDSPIQLAGQFNGLVSTDGPAAASALQQEQHDPTALRAAAFKGLPSDAEVVAGLDPSLQNLVEIRDNLETMLERYEVAASQAADDPAAYARATELLDRIGEQASLFNEEVDQLAVSMGSDELEAKIAAVTPETTASDGLVVPSEGVRLADNSVGFGQGSVAKI